MDIFEIASRKAFRFSSSKGDLTTEQLWTLPLISKSQNPCDLDTIARSINADLKSMTEESFVNVAPDPRKGDLEVKLAIVKRVIDVRQEEIAAAQKSKEKAELRKKLAEALADKRDNAIKNLSEAEIEAKLKELDA